MKWGSSAAISITLLLHSHSSSSALDFVQCLAEDEVLGGKGGELWFSDQVGTVIPTGCDSRAGAAAAWRGGMLCWAWMAETLLKEL